MRISQQEWFTFPNGESGIRIPAGPGMRRKIRRLVAEHGVIVEAVSRRGRVIARGHPPSLWQPHDVCYMTWGGVGRPVPRRSSYNRPRSGARAVTCWKESESVLRRKRARAHLQLLDLA